MPTPQDIEAVVEKLKRENRRISLRNVRSELPRGGSYSDIGPALVAWRAKASSEPACVSEIVPRSLSSATDTLTAKLWNVAREEAEKIVEQERRENADLKREFEREALVAWAEVDRLMDEVAALRRRLASAGIRVDPALNGRGPALGTAATSHSYSRDGSETASATRDPILAPGRTQLEMKNDRELRFWEIVLAKAAELIQTSGKEMVAVRDILEGLPRELRKSPNGVRLSITSLAWAFQSSKGTAHRFVRHKHNCFGLQKQT